MSDERANRIVVGCLSRIGLAAVIAAGTASILTATFLVPPWVEVKTQRQVGIFFSHHVKDYEQHFIGYDFIFSESKVNRTDPPGPRSSGYFFDATEHRIWWPVLMVEWTVVVVAAVALFAFLSWRLRTLRKASSQSAEPVS
ncbi:hypothetical protein AYO40_03145 [Planctomycetaceae bacterium SCGC AG-212-D15]|nr:hypothetical protein AYO40_03145 [Planctomycetaceae bacterium SCGC AG-212-D15]